MPTGGMDHGMEWAEAQKIEITVDLISAAKQQLLFLAEVDRNRHLYEGPALQRAIYRYNAFWLPLLAKYAESPLMEGPLVVPLDCEWVWHCHRLNPVQYKSDCEKLYGRILDNVNVVSSIQGICASKTKEIWSEMYEEPYELDLTTVTEDITEKVSRLENCTTYDLVSAVKRQSPFFYQVSRPHINHGLFLQEAASRYQGFLHLIRRNKERSIKQFCVPTYDIDLMWHTHQLHPLSYCNNLMKILGKVLEHDDMDSDRTKGKKLDTGFSGTTAQWEQTFGTRYWKAGAMYRGTAPSPVTEAPFSSHTNHKIMHSLEFDKLINVPDIMLTEVLLEIVGVRNLPEDHKGKLYVSLSKSQPDTLFDVKRKATISSESGEKMVVSFHCEPRGKLLFELVSNFPSSLPLKGTKVLGSTSLSLQDYFDPVSKLSDQKWLGLAPHSGHEKSKPISLLIAISFTVPTSAPYMLDMVRTRPSPISSCLFPFPERLRHAKSCSRIINALGLEVITLQMRSLKKDKVKENSSPTKEVIAIMKSGKEYKLAGFSGDRWSLLDSQWSLQIQKNSSEDDYLCEITGIGTVKFFWSRKLEYQPRHFHGKQTDKNFVTAVEFSTEYPYGEAVALIDLKSGSIKVKKEALLSALVTSAFIISDALKNEGYHALAVGQESLKINGGGAEETNDSVIKTKPSQVTSSVDSVAGLSLNTNTGEETRVVPITEGLPSAAGCGGGCGSGCGGGCGNMVKSGGCGSGCGGGCGSGCGGGCGNMVKSGGCGSSCGGGCGSGCGGIAKNSGAGGCGGCGGGCGGCGGNWAGNSAKSGGCGGCGAGGCGAILTRAIDRRDHKLQG
ncbi:hypothetical protein SAY86_027333 [Trapa natans]|uniref:Glycine-rich domain-containing protein 1 n=1 Tax=Trapa natans TaxID=22666 RepID=A0AAN7KHC3_TRANT|nr:hypothetical protein SAY86_027333 [Trapa natans]